MKNLKVIQSSTGNNVSTTIEYNGNKIPGVQSIKTHFFINDMGLEETSVLEAKIYNPDWFSSEKSSIIYDFIDAIKEDGGRVVLLDLEPTEKQDLNWGSILALCAGITGITSMLSRGKKQVVTHAPVCTSKK